MYASGHCSVLTRSCVSAIRANLFVTASDVRYVTYRTDSQRIVPPQPQPYSRMNQEIERVPDPRLAEIAGALRNRLRPVCSHLREEEFETLVDEIAQRERRWERRSNMRVVRNADQRAS